MRIRSDTPAKSKGGGYVHRLAGADTTSSPSVSAPRASSGSIASLERRHKIYGRLLAALPLEKRHGEQLLARGCSREEIKNWNCGTLPLPDRAALAKQCHRGTPDDLIGVPGFYIADGRHGKYWTVGGSPGILIPCRGPDGKIRGIRIRPDAQGEGGKYRWFSSGDREGGASSGVHCHVARPKHVTDSTVWLTEGEIKANISAERLGAVVVSVPGVTSWATALPDLAELLPDGSKVVVAFDSDWQKNQQVHGSLWQLGQACIALGYDVEVATWKPTYKGLDDLLIAGLHPQRMALDAIIPEPAWELKVMSMRLAEATARPSAMAAITLTDVRAALRKVFESLSPCT